MGKIGNAGRVYYMPDLRRPCSLAMNMFALRFVPGINSKYVYPQFPVKSTATDRL
jgi:type I restriction enzyme S subunit